MNKKKIITIVTIIAVLIIIGIVFLLLNRNFQVTFYSNGGSKVESQTVKYNTRVKEPEKPFRDGFVFLGWYLNDNDKFNFNKRIKENVTLIAKWQKVDFNIVSDKNELKIDENLTLKLVTHSENISIDELEVAWKSSDENIAKVDKQGKVTAVGKGKAIITAIVNGIETSFELNVIEDEKQNNNNNINNINNNNNITTTTTNNNKNTNRPSSTNNNTLNNETNTEDNPTPVTYTYKWEKIESSVIGQYYLYIVSSDGKKVSGTATITTKSGTSETVSIPSSGKIFVKDTVSSVSNIKVN